MKNSYKILQSEINLKLKVNIFEKSRERKYVDARALYCYVLRKDYKYTLQEIINTFKENGLYRNHATILHCVRMYDVASNYNSKLEQIRKDVLIKTIPHSFLINKIEAITDDHRLRGINNFINFQEEQIN